MSIEENDKRVLRCRMLGHEVNFNYCREGIGCVPCRKIFDCWFETFDVVAFIRQHYSPEQIAEITAAPKPKISSLVDLIQQAQERTRKSGKDSD